MADEPDARLDARGWKCPLPVLRASRLMALAAPGEVLRVEATDPRSGLDFREWAEQEKEIEILSQKEIRDPDGTAIFVHLLRKR